ncbi:UvrD-helicase domain-containing protein [Roseibacillus ishigakijimensis]|uniref:DNA 3'-5' helicase n=1 Tax=Roseibacillus ishigakijimensis TaxID=454146 RepID=A0A934RNG2_9BACT|nr:UvrD-helicase domain-containing protein [Roseibacillus ishigakijimensis]MBK1832616.1 UvrD-helicase domain-containing protein [Roseibacillus ishigakijimensis]
MAAGFDIRQLNTAQRRAVETLDGPVLILAGAGTGKTRTVTCRMANLLDQGVRPEQILAVTFTNKAAREMQERVAGMVSAKAANKLTVCTFHSLCVRLLRSGIEKLGYKKNFSICTPGDQQALIKQFIVKRGGLKEKIKPAEVLSAVSKAKNSPVGFDSIEDELIKAIAIDYQNELRARNCVDFDDLLLLGEQLLREHGDERAKWQEHYRYVTVDEFQDTNALQMNLLRNLVGTPYNVCVVGDDDQSIYGWRGAEVANILQFERFFPDPEIILLEENYRSTQAVLSVANKLIKGNAGRREKELKATIPGGDLIQLVSFAGEEEEAEWVADEMKRLRRLGKKGKGGKKAEPKMDAAVQRMLGGGSGSLMEATAEDPNWRPWEDFAVLFRTNTQIRKMEQILREKDIPYRLVGAQSFYDRREVRDVLAFLQVIADPHADVPLLRILNTPPRGISNSTALVANDWSRERGTSIWTALHDEDFLAQLGTRARNAIAEFESLVELAHVRLMDGETPREVLESVLESCDYVDWLMRNSKTDKEKDQRRMGLDSFFESMDRAAAKGKSVQTFLEETLLDPQKDDELSDKKGVTLITLHAAKGLEYPVVFLVGLEEGILPHKRSLEERTVDEERRLLYVGITRAQERLALTYCSSRVKWGEEVLCEPSSFISELDFDWIEEIDHAALMQEEASEDDVADFLGGLRAKLQ